ncbi:MAG: glycosyl hydrolase, partial [Actinomycetota bacterium]
VYITFHAEPEYSGTAGAFGNAADYRAAYRRIVDRFRAQGVTNVKWVPVLMAWTFARSGGNPGQFWPGDAYVDAVGVDGYNWFGCSGGAATWNSFGSIFQKAYSWIAGRRLPMMVVEWGAPEDRADPFRKANWLTEAATWIKSHPNIKVVEYFHARDINPSKNRDCDWTVDSSLWTRLAFHDLATDPYFNP